MQAAAALGRARSDFGLWLLPRDRGPQSGPGGTSRASLVHAGSPQSPCPLRTSPPTRPQHSSSLRLRQRGGHPRRWRRQLRVRARSRGASTWTKRVKWRRWHRHRHHHASLLWCRMARTRCRAQHQRVACTSYRTLARVVYNTLSCGPTASGRTRAMLRLAAVATATSAIGLPRSAHGGGARTRKHRATAMHIAGTSSGGCCKAVPRGSAKGVCRREVCAVRFVLC